MNVCRVFHRVAVVSCCMFLTAVGRAQEPASTPVPDGGPVPATDTLREQTIYIPYQKLRETFEKEGRGVFLPYEKFQELWRAARASQQPADTAQPPIGALITEIDNEAVVGRDVVSVTARVKIDLLGKGWQNIPLRLPDAAILSARIGDQPARLLADPQAGHRLLLEHRSDAPQSVEVVVAYSKAFTKTPGRNSVSFQAPTAPVNRWRVRIPQTGVQVDIQPMIAATEVPEAPGEVPTDPLATQPPAGRDETVWLAFVGAAPEVNIAWTPKSEGAMGLDALTSVQTQQEVTIDEGSLRSRTRLAYSISRAEITQLVLELPAHHKVTGAFDPNVRTWSTENAGELQKLTVQLFEPARGTQNLVVEMERLADDLLDAPITVPVVRALGAGRQQGVVAVALGQELRAEISARRGAQQLDAAELPPPLASASWAFAFRYAAVPFDLALAVQKIQPLVRVEELIEAYVEPHQLTLDLFAIYEIERAGVFQLALKLPAGYELRSVRGREGPQAPAAAVASFHVDGDQQENLTVNLARKAMGRIGLFLELQRRVRDPNLLAPTGVSSPIQLVPPRVTAGSVEHAAGKLVVYAPESLLLNPSQVEGLTAVSQNEVFQTVPSARDDRFAQTRPVLAFAFAQPPSELTLAVERRRHQITARQLLLARIEAGVVKYSATFHYEILYSGVKSLRLDVPQTLAPKLNLQTTGIRKSPIDPPPADVAADYLAWSLAGENELLGQLTIRFDWEEPIQELAVGTSVALTVPELLARDTDRSWGQIVVAKAETLDVAPDAASSGLRPIDPQLDVVPDGRIADAAMAFEFHDRWKLNLKVSRYELENVQRTSIERAVLRAISTLSGQVSMQALFQVRSAQQRIAVRLPGETTLDIDPLRINGRPVALERGTDGTYLVPLTGQSPDQPFLLEVRYAATGGKNLEFPVFPGATDGEQGAAMQKVYLCAYLPEELALLGAPGPWEDELSSRWFEQFGGHPAPQHTDQELVQWVREGIETVADPFLSFPTQGRLYVFSTLRPEAPPAGSLQLITMPQKQLYGLVYGVLVLLGIAFLRSGVSFKLGLLACLLVALLGAGVFLPIFALQVIDGPLLLGIASLGGIWLLASLVLAVANRPSRVPRPSTPAPPPDNGPGSASPMAPNVSPPSNPSPNNASSPASATSPFASGGSAEQSGSAPSVEQPRGEDHA